MVAIATEHPHIVRQPGLKGGQPVIAGTGITVRHVAALYRGGESVEDIVAEHPPLTAAQGYDAISYYLDHRPEIDALIERNRLRAVLRERDLLYVVGRGLMSRDRFRALPVAERQVWYSAETLPETWD